MIFTKGEIVRPVKEPVACTECGGVEYYKHGKFCL